MNENPKCCIISAQEFSVLKLLLFQHFLYSCMKEMFFHAREIAVCEKNKGLYFRSDEIKGMEDFHHPFRSFLYQ